VGAEGDVLAAMAERVVAPTADPSGPHLGVIADALAGRRALRFKYRPPQGQQSQRTVDPFSLVFRGGHWYVVGLDRDRGEVRAFRLSRIRSAVKAMGPASSPPAGFDATKHLESGPWGLGEPDIRARVAFSPKVAWWAIGSTPGVSVRRTRRDGWVETDVPASRTESFVSWVLGFGPDARVYSPKPIRDEVVARLESLAGAGR
jgi:predicted DNA-binding transcriptional regulator YafY